MLRFRKANINDTQLLFDWANDPLARANSYNTGPILYEEHVKWFHEKLSDPSCWFYIFMEPDSDKPIGQVRIERKGNENVISVSLDKEARGQSYGSEILKMACRDFLEEKPGDLIFAYIKKDNLASLKSFSKAGFKQVKTLFVKGTESYLMEYKLS